MRLMQRLSRSITQDGLGGGEQVLDQTTSLLLVFPLSTSGCFLSLEGYD